MFASYQTWNESSHFWFESSHLVQIFSRVESSYSSHCTNFNGSSHWKLVESFTYLKVESRVITRYMSASYKSMDRGSNPGGKYRPTSFSVSRIMNLFSPKTAYFVHSGWWSSEKCMKWAVEKGFILRDILKRKYTFRRDSNPDPWIYTRRTLFNWLVGLHYSAWKCISYIAHD